MAFAATLKSNYSDLNFGHLPLKQKTEILKISLHRFYSENKGTLIAFNIQGNDDRTAHLKSADGAVYMTVNEVKWLTHHLNEGRFTQLNQFFANIGSHVKDMIAISEEFDEHYLMIPNYLQDKVYVSSGDADIIINLLDRVLTLN